MEFKLKMGKYLMHEIYYFLYHNLLINSFTFINDFCQPCEEDLFDFK